MNTETLNGASAPIVIGRQSETDRASMRTIGASDVSTIIGLNPYQTPLQWWSIYTGRMQQEETTPMRRGKHMESAVASWLEEELHLPVVQDDNIYRHPRIEWLHYSPDRMVYGPFAKVPAELKTRNQWVGEVWDTEPDDSCQVQLQIGLEVMDQPIGVAAAIIGGEELKHHFCDRDTEAAAFAIDVVDRFRTNHILTDIPPPAIAKDNEIMSKVFQRVTESSVALPETALEWIQIREDRKAHLKALEEEIDAAEAKIKAAMGENSKGQAGCFKISWASQTRTSFDSKAFEQTHPDLFQQFIKQSSFRVLRISGGKK